MNAAPDARAAQREIRVTLLGGALLLQAAALAGALSLAWVDGRRTAHRTAEERLRAALGSVEAVLGERRAQLARSVSILISDFAFRQVAVTADNATLGSAASNLAGRVGAARWWVFGQRGDLKALSSRLSPEDAAVAAAPPVTAALDGAPASGATLALGGSAVELVAAPILVPRPAGALAAAFPLDDALAAVLGRAAACDVSFAAGASVTGSTLGAEERAELAAALGALPNGVSLRRGPGGPRMTLSSPLGPGAALVLELDWDAVLAPQRALRARLLQTGLVALLLGSALAWAAAERFGRRARELIEGLGAANERLKAQDGRRAAMLEAVSRGLRAPMAALLAETGKGPGANPATLAAAARQADMMLADLADSTELDSGSPNFAPRDTDLVRVIEDVRGALATAAAGRGVTLECSAPAPVRAPIDARRIAQALRALCENAVQASAPGATVKLGASAVFDEAVLSVSDAGPGIAPADIPRLLGGFQRGAQAVQERPAAIGLGLKMAADIARLHGGTLRLESVPRQGTTASLHIPLNRTGAPKRP